MDRILIVGVDSLIGRRIAEQLSSASDIVGFWLQNPAIPDEWASARMEEELFGRKCQEADVVIFCGGAAVSSWDPDFGHFHAEKKWLNACLTVTRNSGARFVYLSSDAVFGGPWLFHDDDSESYAETKTAREILGFENIVRDVPESLIVRTNVLSGNSAKQSFTSRILERIQGGECEHVESAVFSTPIAVSEFATILTECLTTGMSGCVNIGGAERTSPFLFATLLAAGLGGEREHFVPTDSPSDVHCEQGLRCSRLRQELKIPSPMLSETIDQIVSELPATNRQTAAA